MIVLKNTPALTFTIPAVLLLLPEPFVELFAELLVELPVELVPVEVPVELLVVELPLVELPLVALPPVGLLVLLVAVLFVTAAPPGPTILKIGEYDHWSLLSSSAVTGSGSP